MTADEFVFNGINAATGGYLNKPLTFETLLHLAKGEKLGTPDNDAAHQQELAKRNSRNPDFLEQNPGEQVMGVAEGIDQTKLEETGWGLIFAHDEDRADGSPTANEIREALSDLIKHRQSQNLQVYKEFIHDSAYRKGQDKQTFITPYGIGPGELINPKRQGVPYYLLIVGDPETIPYSFQYQLDVQFAVGRIHFDTLEEYANYAKNVVAAETSPELKNTRRACFFGVRNEDDRSTIMSADQLVKPMTEHLQEEQPDWMIEAMLADQTTKQHLSHLLGGSDTPDILFTASHGVGFPAGDYRQERHQGALLCQDWPGPIEWGNRAIGEDFYFSGDDIGEDARMLGMMAFFFACYGAGTPHIDNYNESAEANYIAKHAFLANLPRRMISHPRSGALAVIGHVERAWGYSFMWEKAGAQLEVFKGTLKRLMKGHPIGSAMEYFNDRYAQISASITSIKDDLAKWKKVKENSRELVNLWTANNDARNYAIIGDPAVRLPHAIAAGKVERPSHDTTPQLSVSFAPVGGPPTAEAPSSAQKQPATQSQPADREATLSKIDSLVQQLKANISELEAELQRLRQQQ